MSWKTPVNKIGEIAQGLACEPDVLLSTMQDKDVQAILLDYAALYQAKRDEMELDVGLPGGWRGLSDGAKLTKLDHELELYFGHSLSKEAVFFWVAKFLIRFCTDGDDQIIQTWKKVGNKFINMYYEKSAEQLNNAIISWLQANNIGGYSFFAYRWVKEERTKFVTELKGVRNKF